MSRPTTSAVIVAGFVALAALVTIGTVSPGVGQQAPLPPSPKSLQVIQTLPAIPRGLDFLTTIRSDQYIELSSELLGRDMEPFAEVVTLVGAQLQPPMGNADTVMERLRDGKLGEEIPTRLVAFANVSAAPIKLKGKGRIAGYYDLYVTLSPTQESVGKVVFRSSGEKNGGGTFESRSTFWPLFELRPLGGGESIFVDTGKVPVPGFPMNLGSTGGRWSLKAPVPNAVRSFRSKPVFYEGEIIITVKRADQSARIPMAGGKDVAPFVGGPNLLAACAKIQAEFLRPGNVGLLGRVGFGSTKEFANLELE